MLNNKSIFLIAEINTYIGIYLYIFHRYKRIGFYILCMFPRITHKKLQKFVTHFNIKETKHKLYINNIYKSTLLRCRGGGAKSSFDFLRLSFKIIRAAAKAMMNLFYCSVLWFYFFLIDLLVISTVMYVVYRIIYEK